MGVICHSASRASTKALRGNEVAGNGTLRQGSAEFAWFDVFLPWVLRKDELSVGEGITE